MVTLTSQTVEVHGFELPWKEYRYHGGKKRITDRGEVFIPLGLFEQVCERTSDDYLIGHIPDWHVSPQQKWALVQARFAEEETRGLIHGTEKGRGILNRLIEEYSSRMRA